MKIITTTVAVLFATMFMTACEKKEVAAPAEAAPAEATPPATTETPPNNQDAGQTSGDKVAPTP